MEPSESTLVDVLPTTISGITITNDEDCLSATYIWGGDSRGYIIDANGISQVTEDDVNSEDAFTNITDNSIMNNRIHGAARKELFTLHSTTINMKEKCILLCATDGCYDYFNSPMVFEYLKPETELLPFLVFIMAAFSAQRLAKFNLDERQALGFIGLPTPANALFWGALIVGAGDWMKTAPFIGPNLSLVILTGVFISCFLLVSEIPMFALKFKTWGWKGNEIKYLFLLTCIPLLLLLGISGLAVIIAWYVVLSILTNR